jgi:hypothetical protein
MIGAGDRVAVGGWECSEGSAQPGRRYEADVVRERARKGLGVGCFRVVRCEAVLDWVFL